jgi:formate C-acetyltransferase
MSEIRDFIAQKKHHKYRTELESYFFYSQFKGLSAEERMTRRFEYMCSHQEPVILPGEKIVFLRTIANLPDCFSPEEWDEIKKDNYVHELGYNSNLCCDFEKVIKNGLLSLKKEGNEHSNRMIDALLSLCDRYAKKALDEGREEIYLSLKDAPRYGAKSFRQALQLFRIVHRIQFRTSYQCDFVRHEFSVKISI